MGASAWLVYCAACRCADGDRGIADYRLGQLTGLSGITVEKALEKLCVYGLLALETRQAEDGSELDPLYILLELEDAVPVETLPVPPDPWAIRPLAAAIAELQTTSNKLAVVARLYAMRFDADTYPFDFGRMGRVAKIISGGPTRLCQLVWSANLESVRGNPLDYLTAIASREKRRDAVNVAKRSVNETDPQMRALQRARQGIEENK